MIVELLNKILNETSPETLVERYNFTQYNLQTMR